MTFAKTRVFLKGAAFIDLNPYRTGLSMLVGAKTASCEAFLTREQAEELYGHLGRFLAGPGTRISTTLSSDDRWHSSDTAVATVDQEGRVTAVGPGDVVIAAPRHAVSGTLSAPRLVPDAD